MRQRVFTSALPMWIDPASAYRALCRDSAVSFWLDSGPEASGGMSYLGPGARSISYRLGGAVIERDAEGERELPTTLLETIDGWDRERLPTDTGLGPFQLGWVGWLGFELHQLTMGTRSPQPDLRPRARHPDAFFLHADRMLAFDHERRTVTLMALAEDRETAELWFERIRAGLAAGHAADDRTIAGPSARDARAGEPLWASTPAEYLRQIGECQRHIRDGDAYQLCLTTKVTVPGAFDPLDTFEALRRANPTHHSGLIVTPEVALVSSSPEQFLSVSPDRRIQTSPIKGTRRRDPDPAVDAALGRELVDSDKERAENLMIVDLMRNDLGRVCELGTVSVSGLHTVESYRTVHQLVSTVEGRLRPEVTLGEVLRATFPAGSMTGAPKHSAVELLGALEGRPRGIYSGAFGYLGSDGRVDLAMTIRSIVLDESGASIGTGGGITALSVPDEELAEVRLKAEALLHALGF